MRRIGLPALLAAWACSQPDGDPLDRPLPLTPDSTVPPAPQVVPLGSAPYLGGSSPNDPAYEATVDRCTTRPAQDVTCIDADLVPPLWSLEPAYEYLDQVRITEDVNGDGLVDARLDIRREDAASDDAVIVYGPLVRELVLPRDADLHVVESHCWWGDRTGDGEFDGLCQADDPTAPIFYVDDALGLVVGPLPQRIDPDLDSEVVYPPPQVAWDGVDTDFDGLIEPAVLTIGRVELWRGDDPATWMVGEPDLTLQFPCATESSGDPPSPFVAMCANDDEGDGVHDLMVGLEYTQYTACVGEQDYLAPAATVGFVDLASSPLARKGSCLAPAGDQDLDGIDDFDMGSSVMAGPTTWIDGAPISPTLFSFHEDLRYEDWTGVDFTGDGIDDWWTQRWDPGDVDFPYVILSGGAGGGVVTGVPSWHVFSAVDAESAYTEDGTNYMVFTDDAAGVRFVPIE